ncbi:hypothetical protein KPL70_014280 [Citrus sinensis]|nr:hypothetical protein KPL70_014280 [Citrus sinensis]
MINNHIWGPEFDENHQGTIKTSSDPLHIHGGPITRARAKKMQAALNGLIEKIWIENAIQDARHHELGLKRRQGIVGIIQVIGQPNTQVVSNAERPHQPVYSQFFGFSHLQPTPQPKPSSPKKSKSKVKISEPKSKPTSSSSVPSVPPEDSPTDTPEPPKKDKGPMDQYHYHTVQDSSFESSEPETVYESNPSESNPSSSSSSTNSTSTSTNSESEYADITSILMATKTEDPSASTSTPIVEDSSSNDEHPASHTEPVPPMPPPAHDHLTKPSSASSFTFGDIPRHKWPARLQEFAAWIDLEGTKPNAQSQAVLREFMARSTGSLRDWLESLGEYRQLQFMQSPVESHYKRMSILFYKLNGFNEPSLKHVFIASLPSELQPDLQRKLTTTNLSIADISLGKIFQMAMLCLDKICEQKEFFKDLMANKKSFSEACKKPYLKMECKDEKKKKKPNRCFICKKCGHFARNCPHKSAKAVRLIQHLQHSSLLSENKDVESNFSEQLEQDDQTAFIIAKSLDSEDISVISTVQNVNHVSTIPRPSLKMSILPSKFHKLVPVIGFIDTGTDTSMIDPSVLPSDYWEPHSKLFRVVNGETFETTLITKKPIGIQFFPNCIIWKKIVASKLPDKDLLIGFDVLYLVKNLFLTSSGVRYKQMFLPYTDTLRLYALLETPSPYNRISQKFLEFCLENHSQFHYPSPLWKNEQFFIHLPFKLNEDINPTKASHPVTIHTNQLSRMLKKQCPPLGPAQTEVVKQLKASLSPLCPSVKMSFGTCGVSPPCTLQKQRPDYTNVLFQDAQDPWEDFHSLLHTENPHYTVTNPDSPVASTSQHMTEADEEKYQQAETYLDQRQIRRHKRQYEKETGGVSPSHYPSTP